ncbi:MAG: methylmalonyl Co-A mutase-associated GTPase MeaB [Candidatus Poseidoniales archaeon]|nr:MAG: methylmalonyl Co-A mutase-associated GTPase MeaB [Candidatus Poseidoniales archaeon]RCH75486.1 MAG: methylmalonyl Co-A mutase-associated GTPase MeaB [Candidatus Poseidoniales archaeon]RCH76078.1 MAG: methylmalonyl Co-A mutase-associated GTPase MeaB [Candidatus Poseidoniales archaeon]
MALELIDQEVLLQSAFNGNRRELSRLLTHLEKGMKLNLPENAPPRKSTVLGITGPPGVGKSTLIGRIINYWKERNQNVAVLAIDPSSPRSGGALLGDRVRMDSADSGDLVFVRSLSTGGHPGGISSSLISMIDLLSYCGWENIVIETVGSGQSEIKIVAFADKILLVDGPDRGDIIQAEKAGIIELADIVVINKSDLPGSTNAAESIRSSLSFGDVKSSPEVILVSAQKNEGVEEMMNLVENCHTPDWRERIKLKERLISLWDSRLLSSPEFNRIIGDLQTGSISLDDALDELAR